MAAPATARLQQPSMQRMALAAVALSGVARTAGLAMGDKCSAPPVDDEKWLQEAKAAAIATPLLPRKLRSKSFLRFVERSKDLDGFLLAGIKYIEAAMPTRSALHAPTRSRSAFLPSGLLVLRQRIVVRMPRPFRTVALSHCFRNDRQDSLLQPMARCYAAILMERAGSYKKSYSECMFFEALYAFTLRVLQSRVKPHQHEAAAQQLDQLFRGSGFNRAEHMKAMRTPTLTSRQIAETADKKKRRGLMVVDSDGRANGNNSPKHADRKSGPPRRLGGVASAVGPSLMLRTAFTSSKPQPRRNKLLRQQSEGVRGLTVWVGGISQGLCSESEDGFPTLRQVLSKHCNGSVASISVREKQAEDGSHKGWAFVTFADRAAWAAAVELGSVAVPSEDGKQLVHLPIRKVDLCKVKLDKREKGALATVRAADRYGTRKAALVHDRATKGMCSPQPYSRNHSVVKIEHPDAPARRTLSQLIAERYSTSRPTSIAPDTSPVSDAVNRDGSKDQSDQRGRKSQLQRTPQRPRSADFSRLSLHSRESVGVRCTLW